MVTHLACLSEALQPRDLKEGQYWEHDAYKSVDWQPVLLQFNNDRSPMTFYQLWSTDCSSQIAVHQSQFTSCSLPAHAWHNLYCRRNSSTTMLIMCYMQLLLSLIHNSLSVQFSQMQVLSRAHAIAQSGLGDKCNERTVLRSCGVHVCMNANPFGIGMWTLHSTATRSSA